MQDLAGKHRASLLLVLGRPPPTHCFPMFAFFAGAGPGSRVKGSVTGRGQPCWLFGRWFCECLKWLGYQESTRVFTSFWFLVGPASTQCFKWLHLYWDSQISSLGFLPGIGVGSSVRECLPFLCFQPGCGIGNWVIFFRCKLFFLVVWWCLEALLCCCSLFFCTFLFCSGKQALWTVAMFQCLFCPSHSVLVPAFNSHQPLGVLP